MKHCTKFLTAALLSVSASSALALETTIDFEDQALLTQPSLTIDNVTFSGSNIYGTPATFFISDYVMGDGSNGDSSGNYLINGVVGFSTLTFSFASSVNQFSFNLGDNQNDWELSAFNESGMLLDSLFIDRIPANASNDGALFGLSSQNFDISYATLIMGSGPPSPIPLPDSIEIDNFTYTTESLAVSPVPEPSTYALMLGGLGMVGFMAYRRRKIPNA